MPPSKRKVVGPSEEEWESRRMELEQLYVGKDSSLSLSDVMEHMKNQYNFVAKPNQFHKYLHDKWKLEKNVSSSTWDTIYPYVRDIEYSGKEAEVWINGVKKSSATVRKQTTRKRSAPVERRELPPGIIVREVQAPLLLPVRAKLPFQVFGEALHITLPLLPPINQSSPVSSQVATGSRARDVWRPGPQVETALQAVVPLDLIASTECFSDLPLTADRRLFSSPLHMKILFSVANNFAGLGALSQGEVIKFLQLETSEGLYKLIKSAPEHYTTHAIALNLFRAAIEVGDARIVEFLIKEPLLGIKINSFICSYINFKCTPVERAAALLHKDVVEILIDHGADVTISDCNKTAAGVLNVTGGALYCALTGMHRVWQSERVTKMDLQLLYMIINAGGELDNDMFKYSIEYDKTGDFVRLLVAKQVSKHYESWKRAGVFFCIFEFQNHQTCLDVLETMVLIGVDLNYRMGGTMNQSLIDIVAKRGNLDLVKILLQKGVEITDDTLCCGILSGNIALTKHLLEIDANINTISRGNSPLAAAIRSGNQSLINLIIDHKGLESLQVAAYFRSALDAALYVEDAQWIDYLFKHGDDIQPRDLSQALTIFIKLGRQEDCVALIHADLNPNIRPGFTNVVKTHLSEALENHCDVVVHALLDADYDPTPPVPLAIELAVEWGDHSIIRDLLRAGANPDAFRALNIAINRKDRKTVDILLDAGWDINDPNARLRKKTALRAAVNTNDLDIVTYVLDEGADPHDPSAITDSTRNKTSPVLDLLLARHGDRYPKGRKGWGGDILASAIEHGDHDLFKKFLKTGADAHQFMDGNRAFGYGHEFIDGITALGYAIAQASRVGTMFVELLLNHERLPKCYPESIVSRTCTGQHDNGVQLTAFLAAIGSGHLPTIKILLRHKADVNFPAKLGVKRTPLQRAAELGNLKVVELLLGHGAYANAPAAERGGGTALQLAALGGFIPIVRLLMEKGADLHAPASKLNGRSPLEGAAEGGRLDMVAELLEAGAAHHVRDVAQMNSAISLAERNGHIIVVNMLRNYLETGKVSSGPPTYDEFVNWNN